jgi:hypothetical protein
MVRKWMCRVWTVVLACVLFTSLLAITPVRSYADLTSNTISGGSDPNAPPNLVPNGSGDPDSPSNTGRPTPTNGVAPRTIWSGVSWQAPGESDVTPVTRIQVLLYRVQFAMRYLRAFYVHD